VEHLSDFKIYSPVVEEEETLTFREPLPAMVNGTDNGPQNLDKSPKNPPNISVQLSFHHPEHLWAGGETGEGSLARLDKFVVVGTVSGGAGAGTSSPTGPSSAMKAFLLVTLLPCCRCRLGRSIGGAVLGMLTVVTVVADVDELVLDANNILFRRCRIWSLLTFDPLTSCTIRVTRSDDLQCQQKPVYLSTKQNPIYIRK